MKTLLWICVTVGEGFNVGYWYTFFDASCSVVEVDHFVKKSFGERAIWFVSESPETIARKIVQKLNESV